MSGSNNLSLYIKRAETYQTKEYISEMFASNMIGVVNNIKFIKKTDNNGREYNGVIVVFNYWFMNSKVNQLIDEMGSSPTGVVKFIYNYHNGNYWYVNIYKSQYEEFTAVDQNLPDSDRITALENLVKSMSAQMRYMQAQQEKTERQLMENEQDEMRKHICNVALRTKMEDKDIEHNELISEVINLKEALKKSQEESIMFKCRLACLSIKLSRKQEEPDDLLLSKLIL